MSKTFGVIAAYSKPEATGLAREIAAWITDHGHHVISEASLKQHSLASLEAIVVLGGDGLMMRTANTYPDVPLLGINFGESSLWH